MRCSAFFIDYHHFGYASYGVDYFVLLVELYAVLAVVAEFHRLADVEMSGVGSHLAEEHFYECRFAHAVVAHDAHFSYRANVYSKPLSITLSSYAFVTSTASKILEPM